MRCGRQGDCGRAHGLVELLELGEKARARAAALLDVVLQPRELCRRRVVPRLRLLSRGLRDANRRGLVRGDHVLAPLRVGADGRLACALHAQYRTTLRSVQHRAWTLITGAGAGQPWPEAAAAACASRLSRCTRDETVATGLNSGTPARAAARGVSQATDLGLDVVKLLQARAAQLAGARERVVLLNLCDVARDGRAVVLLPLQLALRVAPARRARRVRR